MGMATKRVFLFSFLCSFASLFAKVVMPIKEYFINSHTGYQKTLFSSLMKKLQKAYSKNYIFRKVRNMRFSNFYC